MIPPNVYLPQIHLFDETITITSHQRIKEGISLYEHIGLNKVNRVRVITEDRGQTNLTDLVELVLGET